MAEKGCRPRWIPLPTFHRRESRPKAAFEILRRVKEKFLILEGWKIAFVI